MCRADSEAGEADAEVLEDRPPGDTSELEEPTVSRAIAEFNDKDADRRSFYALLGRLNGSELVDRAYLAILGRFADSSGGRHYRGLLSQGVSPDRVLWEIANSEEARSRGVRASDVMEAAGFGCVQNLGRYRFGLAHLFTKMWSR